MPTAQVHAKVLFTRFPGTPIAYLTIVERTSGSLIVLSAEEAALRGEEQVQLIEGHSYEYELEVESALAYHLRESSTIQPSRISPRLGRIEPGLATGLLPIVLESDDGKEVGRAHIEVRTNKLDYYRDYRLMLDLIAEKSIGLLLDIHAPAQVRLAPESDSDSPSLHERFAFIRHLLTSHEFRDAINLIVAMPHHRTEPETRTVAIHRGVRPSRSFALSIAKGSHRVNLPASHPVRERMVAAGVSNPSLPQWVTTTRSHDSRDTPENRFVKHALNEFLAVLMGIEELASARGSQTDLRLLREVLSLRRAISEYVETELFSEVGAATMLPLGSPVLQRRNGYREVLTTWLKFSVAARLTWAGGEDVFGAGKKDVALLYEYWLFFILIDVISGIFQFDDPPIASLIDLSGSGFDMKLRSGSAFSITTAYDEGHRPIRVRFSYNRTFSGVPPTPTGSYPRPGSWTRSMRPDFTMSFWPAELTEEQAECEDSIVHVHFDAKYRVDSILSLFGADSEIELNDEAIAGRTNTRPKRSDLLKMHSYRDAIRRTEGAYVLYPGSETGHYSWIEYHEILPGLGAFSVRPGTEQQAKETLTQFIRDILAHQTSLDTKRGLERSPV